VSELNPGRAVISSPTNSTHNALTDMTETNAHSSSSISRNCLERWNRPRQFGFVAALFVVLFVLWSASSVFADSSIGHGSGGSFLESMEPGAFRGPLGVALSAKESGDLYVTDSGPNDRVSQFEPNGTFVDGFGFGILPGAVSGTGDLTAGSTLITNVTTTLGAFATAYGGGKPISGPGIPAKTFIVEVTDNGIEISRPAEKTASAVAISVPAAAGNVPTNEIQRLRVSATAGDFRLGFVSPKPDASLESTEPIPFNAPAAGAGSVQQALEGLSNIGSGNVSVSGGPGDERGDHPYLIEFKGRYADTNVQSLRTLSEGLIGGTRSNEIELDTPRAGGGVLETCTTVCLIADGEEGALESGEGVVGPYPELLNYPDAIAVDNSCSEQEPPLSGAACEAFDSSYGDIYVIDQHNFRVSKYAFNSTTRQYEFLLTIGGGVDETKVAEGKPAAEQNVCTKAELEAGDECGVGVPGTGPSQFYREEPETEAGGFKSWAKEGSNSIAVGPNGTVYVGDYGRIQEFHPDGTFANEFNLEDPKPLFVTALALNTAGDIFERSAITEAGGQGVAEQVRGVREYDPTHKLIRTFDAGSEEAGSEPTDIALDKAGDLYVSDLDGTREYTPGQSTFRAFKPDTTLFAEFTSPEIVSSHVPGIAVDGSGQTLYATNGFFDHARVAKIAIPQPGPPVVTEEHVTDVGHTVATLHAVVNPEQFDTRYRFQWVSQAHFETEGFDHPEQTAPVDLGLVSRADKVQTLASGLEPATKYHWRVLAESHCNPAEPAEVCETKPETTFETLPAVSIRNLTTQTVGPREVTIKAEVNNNDSLTLGRYVIRLGTNTSYQTGERQGKIRADSGSFESIEAAFSNLQPNTEYHYQLLAENEFIGTGHPDESADQTFTTEESQVEEDVRSSCPNKTLREENNSLSLPDCRAYEQATERIKNGGTALSLALGVNGERLFYQSEGLFANAQNDPLAIIYVAHRTANGWVTQPELPRLAPVLEPIPGENLFSPDLNRWLFKESPGLNIVNAFEAKKSGFFSMSGVNGESVLHASPTLAPVEGGARYLNEFMQVGATSDDLSRVYIDTASRLLPAPQDPREDTSANKLPSGEHYDRIYEVAGVGGSSPTLRLAAEMPPGIISETAPLGGGCYLNNESYIGRKVYRGEPGLRVTNTAGTTLFYVSPVERTAGSGCGSGNPNPYGVFARTGEAAPVQLNAPLPSQCSEPAPCATAFPENARFDGAGANGSVAWYTTTQPLVNGDTDTTNDLYAAKLNSSGEVTELVQASAGTSTKTHPTPGNGASVGEDGVSLGSQALNSGVVRISEDGTKAAFESPAVLTEEPNALGQSAIQHANNMYVYDLTTKRIKFVAELCSGPELSGTEPSGSEPQGSLEVTAENAVRDPNCPSTISSLVDPTFTPEGNDDLLWLPGQPVEATFSGDSNVLLFSSYARLTTDDTNNVRDLYRYDFQTGELERISVGHNGNDGNGNDNRYQPEFAAQPTSDFFPPNELAETAARNISKDGSTIIFKTKAPLVSRDTNKVSDIYQWEEDGHGTCREAGGCVSLISDGVDPHGSTFGVINFSGNEIAFKTQRNEISADRDGVADVYVARVDGGFPTPVEPPPCGSPEGCRSAPQQPPTPPKATTEHFVGPGNGEQRLQCAQGKRRVDRHGKVICISKTHHRHKKTHHRHKTRRHRASARKHRNHRRTS